MALRRWNCFCGATGNAGQFCAWCGRRDPGVEPPPLPVAPEDQAPAFDPTAPFAPPAAAPTADPTAPPPAPFAQPPLPSQVASHLEWGGAYGPPRTPRVGLTPVTRMLGVLLVVLLGTGVSAIDRREEDRRLSVAGPDGRTLKTVIADAKRFVEQHRGAPFEREVRVELLDDAEFERELLEDEPGTVPEAAEDEADFEETLKGLQLAAPDDDLESEEEELLSDSVIGFYDDVEKRLVVRGGTLNPVVEQTLVHELVHAWQDQRFDLGELWEEVETDDEALALRSLLEGDANRTEAAWYDAQPESVQEEIDELEEAQYEGYEEPGSRIGRSLGALHSFPYAVGEEFVEALADNGGNDAIDDAFRDPPVSTVQILDPDKYLEGDVPEDPADPQPGGKVLDRGTLGAAALLLTIGFDSIEFETLYAWDGDEYVTWEVDDVTCTTVSVILDTEEARDEIVEALRAKDLGPDAVQPRDDGLTFTTCETD